jgi:hypothetical protein
VAELVEVRLQMQTHTVAAAVVLADLELQQDLICRFPSP